MKIRHNTEKRGIRLRRSVDANIVGRVLERNRAGYRSCTYSQPYLCDVCLVVARSESELWCCVLPFRYRSRIRVLRRISSHVMFVTFHKKSVE